MSDKKSEIEARKEDHIKICLEKKVEAGVPPGFDDVALVHKALASLDRDEIDLSSTFLGKKINAPIIIEAITGGAKVAEKINKNLARAAEEVGVAFGVGSVRAGLADEKLMGTYKVRDVSPNIPVLSNIGLAQLIEEYDIKDIKDSIKNIGADGLAIHLNAMQEAVQPEGNVNWKNSVERLKYFCQNLSYPVVVKETGAGISRESAAIIEKAGASMIDVAGAGGTSFSMVEHYRNKDGAGLAFRNWGIPTACSVAECRSAVKIPVIASGGIRSGIDAVKAVALGANYAGIALPVLEPAMKSHKEVVVALERMIEEMRSAMFLCGAGNVDELKKKDVIVLGRTREWLSSRGIKVNDMANRESVEALRKNIIKDM